MGATEIILIVIGAVIFLLGYLMPARKSSIDGEAQRFSADEVSSLVAGEVEHVKGKIEDIVDETVSYSIEKAERAMERITNEKIMAINEYSDTVLEEINKNHKEVVFLYDMLNDKHDNLMSTINEATIAADEIKQTAKDAELAAAEAMDKIKAVLKAADDASDVIKEAEDTVLQARETMLLIVRTVEKARDDLVVMRNAQPYPEDVVEDVQKLVESEESLQDIVQADLAVLADTPEDVEEGAFTEVVRDELSESVFEEDVTDDVLENIQPEAEEEIPYTPAEDAVSFKPIIPRRVEIIHRPDGDYVAEEFNDISTSEAFTSMGIFAPRTEMPDELDGRTRIRRNSRRERTQENVASVDIQFDQDNNNGRNSNERILELHKTGKSHMAIARELGLGLGEVKLVIDLFEGV